MFLRGMGSRDIGFPQELIGRIVIELNAKLLNFF